MFDIKDYSYELPPNLIAQVPASTRDGSRLLVADRRRGSFSDRHFSELPALLESGDLLIVNNTKVVPARIYGRKESGGRVEVLVLEHPKASGDGATTRLCLLRSSKRPKKGSVIFFDLGFTGQVQELLAANGLARITFRGSLSLDHLLEKVGHMPLPPYIKRRSNDGSTRLDRERYQTVFSSPKGAVAAPTAGLHFTHELLARLKKSDISVAALTLHVGYGTFRPVQTKDIREHRLDEEHYRIGPGTAAAIEQARGRGGRLIAVGTTVVRALESAASPDGSIRVGEGKTDLLITPGFSFKVVEAVITNFHLPKSSLLFLVAAFAGLQFIKEAYAWAIEKEYRFYSYGDAMLIL
jgi:S-adenosylmethionine:tRNA ribosyltransferase-isomerase